MALGSYKIARLFGVDIELDWTFLLLLLLVAVLGSVFLIVVFILLFVCVLIHELAHSITSKGNSIGVKKIILTPLGGASVLEDSNIDPRVEFNISIAGPIMSLVLGCIFGIIATLSPMGMIGQMAQTLFGLNILLGAFNLIPAFPLDGGRVFRSYLQRKHNLYDATMITAMVSKYCMGMIVAGTFAYAALAGQSILYTEFIIIFDLLIVFILYSGMKAEVESVRVRQATKGIRVSSLATKKFGMVGPNAGMKELYSAVRSGHNTIILTRLHEGVARIDLSKKKAGRITVKDLAVPLPSINADAGVVDAIAKMQASGSGVLAVKRGRQFIGIVTASSLQNVVDLRMMTSSRM